MLTFFENYYNKKYNDFERAYILSVFNKLQDNNVNLKNIVNKILIELKDLPTADVIIKKAGYDAKSRAERLWRILLGISETYSIVITDITGQETIKSFGGWIKFCDYREEKPVFCYRDFIARYEMIDNIITNNEERVILRGYYDYYYNAIPCMIKIIGDKEQGKKIITGCLQELENKKENNQEFKKLDYSLLIKEVCNE